jgi:anti-sigma factor ChrR (cupin superfamily)
VSHGEPSEEIAERAAFHVLGLLDAPDRVAFERHLGEGCVICDGEVSRFAATVGELGLAAPVVQPPADLRDRLDREARPWLRAPGLPPGVQVWKVWSPAPSGSAIQHAADRRWETTGLAGIEVQRLAVDHEADRVTMLVRMAPGSAYLPHRHRGVEECYVLEGDLQFDGAEMRAGDYQRMEADSVHPVQSTRTGCLLLIISSLGDELLAGTL